MKPLYPRIYMSGGLWRVEKCSWLSGGYKLNNAAVLHCIKLNAARYNAVPDSQRPTPTVDFS